MNLLKSLATTLTLVASLQTSASTISYAGFSRDSDSKIVNGLGLDWKLADNYDFNHGIDSYSGIGSAYGWRLATTQEVANAFNAFHISNTFTYSGDEFLKQGGHEGWGGFNAHGIVQFGELFGTGGKVPAKGFYQMTSLPSFSFGIPDGITLNRVSGFAEWLNYDAIPPQYQNPMDASSINPFTGEAFMADSIMYVIERVQLSQKSSLLLVRDENYVDVPEPTSILLFLSGLLVICLRFRSKA